MRLIYLPDAETKLIQAAQFYEQRVSTLGSQFLDSADTAIGIIQNAPERWIIIEADVMCYLMPRFPYALYYRIHSDHIRILALKHKSRHQDYWRYRSSDQTANI